VAGWSKSAPKLLKFSQGVLLMYWACIPSNDLVIAKNTHLNPFYCLGPYNDTSSQKYAVRAKKTPFLVLLTIK
jgi:hypothetical protein